MFIVIGDGKVLFSTDVDDVAWDYSQEISGECENIYVEEAYTKDFDSKGNYTTTEGDIISLEEIIDAEQEYRNEDQRPKKIKAKKPKKEKKRKSYRQYLDGQISTMQPNGVKRLLVKLGVSFDENSDFSLLSDLLLTELNKRKKNKDDETEELFLEVNDCANVPLKIFQLCVNRSKEENREIVIKLLDNLNASYDGTADLDQLNSLLFDYVAAEADNKSISIMESWEELIE